MLLELGPDRLSERGLIFASPVGHKYRKMESLGQVGRTSLIEATFVSLFRGYMG